MPISFIVFYFYSLFVLPGCCDEQTSEPANSQKLSFSEWQIATTSRLFPELWLTWFWINLFYEIIIKKKKPEILVPFYYWYQCTIYRFAFVPSQKTIPDTSYHTGQAFCSNMKGYLWHDFCAEAPLRRNALAIESGTLSPIPLQERCYVNTQSDRSEIENPDIRAYAP